MRKYLTIIALLASAVTFGQIEPHANMVTVDTSITQKSLGYTNTWLVQITYYRGDTIHRPALIFCDGAGQVGTDTAYLSSYGAAYWLQNGWDGGLQIGNGRHYLIYVKIQPPSANQPANQVAAIIDTLKKYYNIESGQNIGVCGFSDGAWEMGQWIQYAAFAGDTTPMTLASCFADFENVLPSPPTPSTYAYGFPQAFGHWASKFHGRVFGVEGTTDPRNVYQITQNMNDSVPGSAYFTYESSGGGGHCCWNNFSAPDTVDWLNQTPPYGNGMIAISGLAPNTIGNYYRDTATGNSVMQWMLRQMADTSLKGQTGAINTKTLKWAGTLAEYAPPFIDSIGRPVIFSANLGLTGNNGAGTVGIPLAVTSDSQFVATANTLHGSTFLTAYGNVFVTGGNDQAQLGLPYASTSVATLQQITVDSRGLPFTNISFACGTYIQNGDTTVEGQLFVKHGTLSDSIFYCGRHKYGMAGDDSATTNDTLYSPTLSFGLPSGVRVLSLTAEEVVTMALSSAIVETWGGGPVYGAPLGRTITGGNYATPTAVTGFNSGDTITQVVGGGAWGVIALNQHGTNLYGWGTYSGYLGNAANTVYATPTLINTNITNHILNGTTRTYIRQITGNSNCYHVLPNDSTLWGWGDDGMSSIGNGVGPNLASPGGSSLPWSIDPSEILVFPQTLPVEVTAAHNYIAMYGGELFGFDFAALNASGQLFFAGRNKGAVLPNGVIECSGDGGNLAASYANSWDVPYLTPMTPYNVTSTIQQTCYGCHTGAVTTNCYSCGTTTAATANAGSNQTLGSGTTATSLNGTASTSTGGKLTTYTWTQTSGPASTIDVPASPTPNIALTGGSGSYVYNLFVQDQGFNTSNSTVTVTVGSATPPTVSAGSNQTITLPTATVTLSGSATAVSPATSITTYAWTQTSGPNTGTFSSTSIASPTFSGLIAGTYVLKLTVTDNNGNTNNASVTITVNAAPPVSPGCLVNKPINVL